MLEDHMRRVAHTHSIPQAMPQWPMTRALCPDAPTPLPRCALHYTCLMPPANTAGVATHPTQPLECTPNTPSADPLQHGTAQQPTGRTRGERHLQLLVIRYHFEVSLHKRKEAAPTDIKVRHADLIWGRDLRVHPLQQQRLVLTYKPQLLRPESKRCPGHRRSRDGHTLERGTGVGG